MKVKSELAAMARSQTIMTVQPCQVAGGPQP
jgi:hypothetical protein